MSSGYAWSLIWVRVLWLVLLVAPLVILGVLCDRAEKKDKEEQG